VNKLDGEQGNLNAALHWCLEAGNDVALGVRLAASLGRYWYLSDQWRDGRAWLTQALSFAAPDSLACAHIVARLGEICLSLSDHAAAQRYIDQAIALWRQLDEREQLAWTLFQAGSLATAIGDETAAENCFAESLALYRAVGNQQRVAMVLMHRCSYVITHGRYAEAAAMAAECLPIFRATGFHGSLSAALNLLGRAVLGLGDFARAVDLFNESLQMSLERHSQSGRAWSLLNLGLACTLHGDLAAGRRFYVDALEDYLSLDRRGGVLAVADGLAAGLAGGDRAADAVALMTATERLRGQMGEALTVQEVGMRESALAAARSQLVEDAWARAVARGQTLTFDQVVALART
jgi:tetratricopeptide (TPR) repeat protein